MIHRASLIVPGVLLLQPVGGTLAAGQDVPELAEGVRQAKDGDFETALLTLDAAVRKLAPTGRAPELAQAHVYLGLAYLGLGQEALATLKFRQAVRHQPDLRLSPDEFSARAIRVFKAARAAEKRAAALQKEARKSKGKGSLLPGAGGAAAVGIGLAVVRERSNTAPAASIAVSPEGQAIEGATRLSFSAIASDAENDPLSYEWDFGDGQSGSGQSVSRCIPLPSTCPTATPSGLRSSAGVQAAFASRERQMPRCER